MSKIKQQPLYAWIGQDEEKPYIVGLRLGSNQFPLVYHNKNIMWKMCDEIDPKHKAVLIEFTPAAIVKMPEGV